MSAPMSTGLRITNVTKTFADVAVLRGVSLDVAAGQVRGLVGPNGAGKTTLIEVLAGRYPDHSGTVEVDGIPVALDTPRASAAAGIAVIHQHFALVPEFTAAQNIALGREPRRGAGLIDQRRIATDARDLLERLDLRVPLDVPVGRLSVAHQQLTEIARALAAGARVLVMDEPTSRLAPRERRALAAIITHLATQGVTILYVSHLLEEVLRICDAVSVLRDGVLVQTSSVRDLTVGGLAEQVSGLPTNAVRAHLPRPTGRPALVLDDFGPQRLPGNNLTVHEGEIVGIAGLLGSGRTALLEAIVGARPHHGQLTVSGRPVDLVNPVQGVAQGVVLVPEDRTRQGVIGQRSVTDNITLSGLATRFSCAGLVRRGLALEAAREAMDRYRIIARGPHSEVCTLSGGNQQKVLLARATQTSPTVLLCDQPTAGVDVGATAEIMAHLRVLTARGVAVVLVSDELTELLTMSDRIVVMRAGRLGQAFPASDLDERALLACLSGEPERGVA